MFNNYDPQNNFPNSYPLFIILQWFYLTDEIIIGATTPCQSGHGSNWKERVRHISHISRTGPLSCHLVPYPEHPV